MKYLIFILFASFFSCNTTLNDKKEDEEFNTFFTRFSNSVSFRKERTIMPFYYNDYSDLEPLNTFKTDTFPISIQKMIKKENVLMNKHIVMDTAKVSLSIQDTGYLIELVFYKNTKLNKWFALCVNNHSI